jgi:outer membrane protein OmpA-like peptidoglycan-associated protein
MSFNLVDSVKSLFTPDLISKAASSLGESEGGISKALSGLVPSVLGGLVSKANSGAEGAGSILNMAKDAMSSGITRNLGGLFSSGGGGATAGLGGLSGGLDAIKGIFGNKLGDITRTISNFAGIKESSASSLMSTAAPAVLGVVGQHAAENNLSPNGLANMLSEQKNNIMSALPSGLGSLSGLLGLGSIGAAISSAAGGARQMASATTQRAEAAAEKAGGGMRWLMPLFLALVVILLVWYFSKGCGSGKNTAVMTDTTTATKDTTMNMGPVSIKVKLPDGTELDAYKGGIEDQLVTYLNSTDPADSISRSRWFDFDNLNFKTGSDDLTDSSMKQVQNIAAILKAYPKVKIKIGGYTDKTGSEPENMKLSQRRADAVMTALKNTGSNPAQLTEAQGYGSQFAKAAADAPDADRKLDRRISINVREK